MEILSHRVAAIGTLSGVSAGYWLGFTCCWTCAYLNARQEHYHMRGGSWFYPSALLYQITAVAYFSAYSVYSFMGNRGSQIVWYVCFVLYMPQAYMIGISCSLGFGTLYTHTSSWARLMVLAVTWSFLTLAGILATVLEHQAVLVLISAAFGSMLILQIAITIHTTLLFHLIYRQYEHQGYASSAVVVYKSMRQFHVIALLFTFQFAILAGESVFLVSGLMRHDSGKVAIWAVFVVMTAVVNSWVLLMMNPNEEMSDMEREMEEVRLELG